MAGLWQDGHYVVLTRPSNGAAAEVHDRMPVILCGEEARHWLNEGELAAPPTLTRTPVSPRINRVENDDPACVEPIAQSEFDFN